MSQWQLIEEKRPWCPEWLLWCFPKWLMLIQPFRWLLFVKVKEGADDHP